MASKLTIAAAVLAGILGANAQATEIWFAPCDPMWRAARNWPASDFMELFRSDAGWPQAIKDVRVVEIGKRFALESSDGDFSTLLDSLRKHGIKLAVQATPLFWTDKCGVGVEGHGPPDDMLKIAQRIKSLGGEISYLTMDEPLWYGHNFNRKLGPNDKPKVAACHSSIDEIAQMTAAKMKQVRAIFPNAVVGDDEPLGEALVPPAQWLNDLKQWLEAYRRAMGEPLGYVHFDVVWQQPSWRLVMPGLVNILQRERIAFGVIYNGTPFDKTDAEWIGDAAAHFELVEGEMHVKSQHAVLQSWTDLPRLNLPEDNPAAFTNLILRYAGRSAAK